MKLKDKTPVSFINAAQEASYNAAAMRAQEQFQRDEERKALIADANDIGVGIVHIFRKYDPKGGLTIAFRKVSPYKNGRMVELAVATCSPEDAFSKKIGTTLALQSWFNGETIKLPLLIGYEDEDINGAVKDAFTALYRTTY